MTVKSSVHWKAVTLSPLQNPSDQRPHAERERRLYAAEATTEQDSQFADDKSRVTHTPWSAHFKHQTPDWSAVAAPGMF